MSDILSRLTAALRERYAVDRQIGEGGMATVYLAEDLKHRRQVAIKVLRPELSASIGAERFLREIEVAARLQHPHVLPVYDSGAADGILYYVMPFVEGESLRDRLNRERGLPIAEAVRIACEVASGLAFAHRHGIVHRDIKPENILIQGGHAVVADFGIARAVGKAAGGATLTGVGLSIGTPAYMSPEQATADQVDARTDQYSLACVLYEMLAGEPAFSGGSVQSIITKNITGPRPRVRTARKEVPEALERVLLKAMAREPGERYATMTELADALGAAGDEARARAGGPSWVTRAAVAAVALFALAGAGAWWMAARGARGPVVEEAQRIAVFPFSTTGQGLDVMGEGMVDLISTNLGGVGGVTTVEPRTLLARWRKRGGGEVDLAGALTVAKELDAGSVLLGSAVAIGPRVRLTAELYDLAGASLGRATIDGHPDSVLSLVDELSVSLLREVWRSNEPMPSLRVAGLTTASLPALRAYLQGEQFYRRSQYDSASAAFGRAIEADSTFALAYYRQVMSAGWIGSYGSRASRDAMAAALRLGGKLPERERTLLRAYKLFVDGRPEAADVMRQYLATNPRDMDAWYLLGESLNHSRTLYPYDPATLRAPFDSVLAMDSSLTPAAIHPIELTLAAADSVGFARYLRVFEAAGATNEVELFRAAGRTVWGRDENLDSLFGVLARSPQLGATYHALISVLPRDGVTSDTLVARYEVLARVLAVARPNERFAAAIPAMMLAGSGRVREALALADSFETIDQELGYAIRAIPVYAGIASPAHTRTGLEILRGIRKTNPWQYLTHAQFEILAGNPAAVPPLLEGGRRLAADTTKFPAELGGLFTAVDGWRMIAQGDTTGGLQRLEAGIRQAGAGFVGGTATMAMRLQWAQALAARPATRAEGIRRLRYGFDQDAMLVPIATFSLAKAYEAAGERDEAAAAYGRFLRYWDKADPELRSYVDDARTSLAKLVGE